MFFIFFLKLFKKLNLKLRNTSLLHLLLISCKNRVSYNIFFYLFIIIKKSESFFSFLREK